MIQECSALTGASSSRLAFGAEVSAPIPHNYPLNGSTAVGAGFAATMGSLELKVCRAQCAIGTKVGIHAGAFVADS